MKVSCPTCRKAVDREGNDFRPFCSARCRLIDLGQWASGKYRIAGESGDDPNQWGEEEGEERPVDDRNGDRTE